MATSHPIPPFPADIDREAFGHWLSGLTDGEGCFKLTWHRTKPRAHGKVFEIPGAKFEISLRDDDTAALRLVWSFLGVGTLIVRPRSGGAKPAARFGVASAPDLAAVVTHFDRYPLRAKKRRDYLIWRDGIELLHRVYLRPRLPRRGPEGGTHAKWTTEERAEFDRLFRAVKAVRAYSSPTNPPEKFTLFGEVIRSTQP